MYFILVDFTFYSIFFIAEKSGGIIPFSFEEMLITILIVLVITLGTTKEP